MNLISEMQYMNTPCVKDVVDVSADELGAAALFLWQERRHLSRDVRPSMGILIPTRLPFCKSTTTVRLIETGFGNQLPNMSCRFWSLKRHLTMIRLRYYMVDFHILEQGLKLSKIVREGGTY